MKEKFFRPKIMDKSLTPELDGAARLRLNYCNYQFPYGQTPFRRTGIVLRPSLPVSKNPAETIKYPAGMLVVR